MIDCRHVQGESLGYVVVVIAVDCMGRSLHCFRRSLYPMLCTYYSLIFTCAIHLHRITLTTARGHNPSPPTVYCTCCKQSILHVHLLPLRVREDKLCRAVERARQIGGLTCDPCIDWAGFIVLHASPGKSRTAPRVWQTNFCRRHAFSAVNICVDGSWEMGGEGRR